MTVMPLLMLILFQPGHHWVIRQQFSPEGGLYLFVSTDTGAPNPLGVHTLRAEMCLFERSGRWQQNLFRNVELQLGLKKLNESDSKIQDFTGVRRWRSVISFGKSTITNEQRGWCSYSNSSCGLKGQFNQIRQRNPSCTSLKASSHPPGFFCAVVLKDFIFNSNDYKSVFAPQSTEKCNVKIQHRNSDHNLQNKPLRFWKRSCLGLKYPVLSPPKNTAGNFPASCLRYPVVPRWRMLKCHLEQWPLAWLSSPLTCLEHILMSL